MLSHYLSLLGFSRAYAPVSAHLTCQTRISKDFFIQADTNKNSTNLSSYCSKSSLKCHFLSWLTGNLPCNKYLVHLTRKAFSNAFNFLSMLQIRPSLRRVSQGSRLVFVFLIIGEMEAKGSRRKWCLLMETRVTINN